MSDKLPLPTLDRIDRRILKCLQKDGGLSNQELAEKVGLSPSPCLRRVRALEEAGIILRRVTLLDARPL
jgi:Lrp/AsnC family leucine-responsive transcriptional regulator